MENQHEGGGGGEDFEAELDKPPVVPIMPGINDVEQAGLDDPPAVPEIPLPHVELIYTEHPYLERYTELVTRALNQDPFKLENVKRSVEDCNRVVFNNNFTGPFTELNSIPCKHGIVRRFYYPESKSIRLGYDTKE